MLSFNKGRPLAKILGGEYDGEIIYLNTEDEDYEGPCCKKCIEEM